MPCVMFCIGTLSTSGCVSPVRSGGRCAGAGAVQFEAAKTELVVLVQERC